MNWKFLVSLALSNIRQSKFRAIVVMSSMVVAIAPLLFILTFRLESQSIVLKQFASVNLRRMVATVKPPLSIRDIVTLNDANWAYLDGVDTVTSPDEEKALILGNTYEVDIDYMGSNAIEVNNLKMLAGRFIRDIDNQTNVRSCVLEAHPKLPLAVRNPMAIGNFIVVNGIRCRIIGLFQVIGEDDYDYTNPKLFYPLVQNISPKGYTKIAAEAKTIDHIRESKVVFRNLLLRVTGYSSKVTVQYEKGTLKSIEALLIKLRLMLLGGALISIVVGGAGVINIMLLTVRDRTKEIGTLKAIGAEKRMILFQFVVEAAVQGVVGGLAGIGVGIVICRFVQAKTGLPLPITVPNVLISFGTSFMLGIIFGYLPALRAAKMSPIEALRVD